MTAGQVLGHLNNFKIMRILDWIFMIAIGLLWEWPTISELYKHGKFKVLRKIAIRNKKKGKIRKKKNKKK